MRLKTAIIITFLLAAFVSEAQIVKGKWYLYYFGPGSKDGRQPSGATLCANAFIFYDSTGFYYSGCEAHMRAIGEFNYSIDSNKLNYEFLIFNNYRPWTRIVKKNIPEQKELTVIVYDFEGKRIFPKIAVVKIGKKKDKILARSGFSTDTARIKRLDKYYNRKVFWTLQGLFPIFFHDVDFRFNEPYNHYEIYTTLHDLCQHVTEGKVWVGGKGTMIIRDEKHLEDNRIIFEVEKY